MGPDSKAHLVYGYNLGGEPGGWKVHEADNSGLIHTHWYSSHMNVSFVSAAERELRATALPPLPRNATEEARADREAKVTQKLGVTFALHGHHLAYQTLLIAQGTEYGVTQGKTLAVTPQMLLALSDVWDRKLEHALKMLGLTPTQTQPQWLLCASYG